MKNTVLLWTLSASGLCSPRIRTSRPKRSHCSWAQEGLGKLVFLQSGLLWGLNFFFSSPNKTFCSRERFLSQSFSNVILFDSHQAAPCTETAAPEQTLQWRRTVCCTVLEASSNTALTHLTKVIDRVPGSLPPLRITSPLVLFVFCRETPSSTPQVSAKSVCAYQTHLRTCDGHQSGSRGNSRCAVPIPPCLPHPNSLHFFCLLLSEAASVSCC